MKKTKDQSQKPQGGASRQAKFREEQRKLDRRGRLYYLTDAEKRAVDSFLKELREQEGWIGGWIKTTNEG